MLHGARATCFKEYWVRASTSAESPEGAINFEDASGVGKGKHGEMGMWCLDRLRPMGVRHRHETVAIQKHNLGLDEGLSCCD